MGTMVRVQVGLVVAGGVGWDLGWVEKVAGGIQLGVVGWVG